MIHIRALLIVSVLIIGAPLFLVYLFVMAQRNKKLSYTADAIFIGDTEIKWDDVDFIRFGRSGFTLRIKNLYYTSPPIYNPRELLRNIKATNQFREEYYSNLAKKMKLPPRLYVNKKIKELPNKGGYWKENFS